MRRALQRLTVDEVNAAIRRHLDAHNLSVVIITRDAAGLKQALASDAVIADPLQRREASGAAGGGSGDRRAQAEHRRRQNQGHADRGGVREMK